MSTPAISGLLTLCRLVSTGTVISTPRAPNSSMLLRRPMRSDSAPNSGCMHM
ncbi:Uncharacterised protein [Mycobacterium tuberculosis]|nr:Uncharacterised protein [Mycobacterium tuberculosis]